MADPTLRIVHIDTERTWRGGENQLFSLIKGLADRGHSNIAVVRAGSALAQKLRSLPCEIFEVSPIGEWNFWAAHQLKKKLKTAQVDVVHAHTAHAVSLAALSTWGLKCPFVLTRRVDFPISPNSFSRWKYNRAKKLIAISKRVQEVLESDGIPPEKITLVPSGIDFGQFQSVKKVRFLDWGLSPDSIVIGQVAALAAHKDQITFLRAIALLMRRIPKVRAVLVGEGPCRRSLESLATELAISSHVHFLGFRENPLDFLAAFDVFCLTSVEEGLGTSVLDAMALHVPVVATRAGGLPEMIEDGVTGLLASTGNPLDIADKLEWLIQHPEEKIKLCAAAARKVQEFNISNTIDKTEQIYQEILAHK